MTTSSEASNGPLQRVACIRYPVQFQEDQPKVKAFINSSSEVNVMAPAYTKELGLTTRKTSVKAQKIDGSPLETYEMVSASFSLQDSLGRVRFFEETFLLADTSIEVVSGMPFLALSNTDFQFGVEELTWRSYTAAEVQPTTSQFELIDKREFAKAALDENSETFVVHVSALDVVKPSIHLSRAAQIAALQ